ncbi:Nitrogen assimilation transcription factor nit-4 [Pseudocercospora fuligena]|uniref:Nitrogen assimilation transcription factor nit-4 n=1 Tax=Pseudocercospora fuligena TaxID=685502 RepID=A0A8H6REN9_9PEZI|nr:Nitrogen assimilation transcription factor nit-4 [Pseudocercospora fuligena]
MAFRILTVKDFPAEDERKHEARFWRPQRRACRHCRIRKTKCSLLGEADTTLPCTFCLAMDLECSVAPRAHAPRKKPRTWTASSTLQSRASANGNADQDHGTLPNENHPSVARATNGFEGLFADSADLDVSMLGAVDDSWFEAFMTEVQHDPHNVFLQTHVPARRLRLRFFRRMGRTAVRPGLFTGLVSVRSIDGTSTSLVPKAHNSASHGPETATGLSPPSSETVPASAYGPRLQAIMPGLLETFFAKFGGHFPFLQPEVLRGHYDAGIASSFLLNAIAALTLRFCEPNRASINVTIQDSQNGDSFLKTAKEQLVTLLSVPAPDVVAGLIILSWAEFGANNDAGLWVFSGMTLRVAQDMGYHLRDHDETDINANAPRNEDLTHNEKYPLRERKAREAQFWSIFILDVCVSFRTGRPPSLDSRDVQIPIPTADDMKSLQLDNNLDYTVRNNVFPELVRLMLDYSDCVALLNDRISTPHATSRSNDVRRILDQIMTAYKTLSQDLHMASADLSIIATAGQLGPFLMLHVFYHTFATILDAQISTTVSDKPLSLEEQRTDPVHVDKLLANKPASALLFAQMVAQLLINSEVVDDFGFLATPFLDHSLFIAGAAIAGSRANAGSRLPQRPIAESRTRGNQSLTQELGSTMAAFAYSTIRHKLAQQARYFAAVLATLTSLDAHEAGPRLADSDHPESDFMIDLSDPGIIARYGVVEK